MVLSLAFILAFIGASVALLIGIIIFSQVQDDMLQTFGDPILISNGTNDFTSITPIDHAFDELVAEQTHTGDSLWTTIPSISLSSGEFTAGNKYLIILRADVRGSEGSNGGNSFDGANYGIRSVHGSTEFVGSELSYAFQVLRSMAYTYFTVWTAVPSEDITMQFIVHNDNTESVFADNISITAIELEDFVENEDYFYNERIVNEQLECLIFSATNCNPTGDWTATNPSVTFTANGSDDWLVMGTSQLNPDGKGDLIQTRLNLDDTLLTPFNAVRNDDVFPEDFTRHNPYLARVYTPSASSHTVEIESSQDFKSTNSNGFGERDYGSIFAINLDKFEFHADNYNPSVSVNPINTQIESNSMTVDFDTTEDTYIMGFLINNNNGGNSDPRNRMEIDNVNIWIPFVNTNHGGQATAGSQTLTTYFTMQDLNSAVDVDVDSLNAFVRSVVDNQVVAMSMSAKVFEFQSQVPDSFISASNIAYTVIGIVPVALFFFLFVIFGGRLGDG